MSHTVETSAPIITENLSEDIGVATPLDTAPAPVHNALEHAAADSLFNRFAWLYVFFRERLFRDDTQRMIHALWPNAAPAAGTRMLELGCGPGFYSCGFASRFPQIEVTGIDRAPRQLDCARRKAKKLCLTNCCFESDDVLDLSHSDESFDLLLAARLFTVLGDRKRALCEMYRVLRSGGRCLIAEPRYAVWASLPLLAMWCVARVTGMDSGCCEPRHAIVLSSRDFANLFTSDSWRDVKTWQDGRYQYALCEKV